MQFRKLCSLGMVAVIGASVIIGCDSAKGMSTGATFDFNENDGDFTAIFSDYPNEKDIEEFYEFQFGHKEVPVNDAGKGLFLSGNNHSDDLFMGYFKELNGLLPETEYQFTVQFKLATNLEGDLIGIGGSPGSSVFVKCGVSTQKPETSLDALNHFRLNIDKGAQSQSGADMVVVGNLEKENNNFPGEYEFNQVQTQVIAKTDKEGKAYLVIGTDSGFEGVTSYYLDDISVNWIDTENASVTRSNAAMILFDHIYRWNEKVGTTTFMDVSPNAPYAQAVAWVQQNGYMSGYGNNLFGPNDTITVEQAMATIYRLYGSPQVSDTSVLDQYEDGCDVSYWAKNAVAWTITNKMLVPDGKILPQSSINMKDIRYAINQIGMAD